MYTSEDKLTGKSFILGFQHLFAMFGATVLVPYLTGLDASVALIGAGVGTLLFHIITKRIVPVFLGSSFAFIGAFQALSHIDTKTFEVTNTVIANRPVLQGGIIAAGVVYMLLGLLAYAIGADRIKKFFPPIVTGPIIILIGLNLTPVAIGMAANNWFVAVVVMLVIITISVFGKSFFKLVPILIGIATGYIMCMIFDVTGFYNVINNGVKFINFDTVATAGWFIDLHVFQFPKFDIGAMTIVAPIAIVTFMEHIGDVTTNGSVVGKDFFKNPGLHKTVFADGVATVVAGLMGAPAQTTYGENTGVLAVTKVYDPRILRIAAVYAIIIGVIGKFGAILKTMPLPVIGGVSIILFGMIASIGLRTVSEAELDFSKSRNLIVVTLILAFGIGLNSVGGVHIPVSPTQTIDLSALFVATVVGIVANFVLPEDKVDSKQASSN